MVLILLRQGDSGGLSGAFGGVGGDAAFGVKAQQHLDKIITYVAGFFVVVSILLNMPAFKPEATSIGEQLRQESAETAPEVPGTPANVPADGS